ncbi:hypothetical protein [Tunturiibacter gelidoferens]|uniref:Uncharacterized protein n=1 Tax=Tunturiibacter lichenicola TaxID=2051959 RepID=A0A7Y9NQ25_9BACT|nr:hypothetical protein [Edaphobacter lichenicola]NYF53478.1 hypothetical protein [Edaphobacter lichenicola]
MKKASAICGQLTSWLMTQSKVEMSGTQVQSFVSHGLMTLLT